VIGGAGAGGQSLGIVRVGSERRVGHRGLEHLGCRCARDELQRVQHYLRPLFQGHSGVDLFDQGLDSGVVPGRGPGDELPRFVAGGEGGSRKRLAEEGQPVVQRNADGLALQLVHSDGFAAGQIAFDVDLVQNRLDRR